MNIVNAIQQSSLGSKAIESYQALAPRDQWAVKILVGFLLPVVLIFGVLMPANAYLGDALERYEAGLEDFQWMEANRAAVPKQGSERSRQPGQSLFGVANSTSKGFQITFKRYEPVDDNALSLWIESVNFNNLVLWLERLDKRHGVSVREIAVERQAADGQVNVRLVLQG